MKGFVLLIISLYIFSCTKEVIEPQKSEKPIFILKVVANEGGKFVIKIGQLFSDKNKSSTDDTIELVEYWK